jgi:hypothetical protein
MPLQNRRVLFQALPSTPPCLRSVLEAFVQPGILQSFVHAPQASFRAAADLCAKHGYDEAARHGPWPLQAPRCA